ncbi:MAG: hypothetical protein WA055_00600 [Candidatus Moraniibacteriota bacterium]
MKEIFKSKKFYILFVFAVAFVFLALINLGQAYQSQRDLLVIFKSEKAAINASIILENLRLLSNPNEQIKVERIGGSSILKFTAKNKTLYTAETLSSQAVKNFISTIGVYYDIRNDIDIRIINGSKTKSSFAGSYSYAFFASLLVGFFLALILNYFLFLFEQSQPKEKIKTNLTWSYKEAPKDEVKQVAMKIEKVKKPISVEEEYIPIFSKKAVAPDNLPVAEEMPVFEQSQKEEPKKEETKTPLIHEATAEEVKERLNRLLSGKL